ncbi:GlxA family transcriptional regulator [Vibrio parahaemolyticus]|uniref:GlxA family transcriptional regulator n=1 Tax=Vibrio parahaemolyticus TaxID=670 RepID=UPI0004A282CA|nr:helix-turn-helix domain-containing protein [Vibrio parahaemolyticus]EGR1548016.1 helix-turn-helix domain-containing protein [Vibrio parahaemolyticus]EGR1984292.1 helix-turn-helix domain-containing protein [Vibrio parahaemolyticus]EGR2181511.1 helix-turn-helix domain-containing protein [Vibrio parahaemolyticus]EGR2216342.1 helix-turn-helix domain-containing protein [Vibrio parahaemolyticus]EIA1342123.1 helix-turn-helix domain-containing protein [Vibrio parahaemolyticus]
MIKITIGICKYPSVLKSAVYGFEEMFLLANRICKEQNIEVVFEPILIPHTDLTEERLTVVFLPPASLDNYYLAPDEALIRWLKAHYSQGAVLSSACAGVFILAATNLIDSREVTTHWALAETFSQAFPSIALDSNKILINHGDIVTAGGMMSWLDLGFELIAKYASPGVVRQLGKTLVIDTAQRAQSYYQQFHPSFSHGDYAIVSIQQIMHQRYAEPLSIKQLAKQANLTERTMQRRFLKATGYNPNQYLQRLRIQSACDLLESTQHSFDSISHQVGYEDTSACRKVFINVIGLTPREFRKRFA